MQVQYFQWMNKKLGRLERVDLRAIWTTEHLEFTPWLAQEQNLSVLADAIGMELELEAQEKDVGPFRADILCKNMNDDSWVLIENQIEKTDHKHLGQLLTYAAGLQAVTIVWVSSKFTEEHRATLDWLNNITDENFRFFGLEIELWKIDDSLPAPKFNVVSKPNNWSKTVSQAAQKIAEEGVTETQQRHYEYWVALQKYLEDNNSKLRPQAAGAQHWQIFKIGRSGVHIAGLLNSRDKRIGVELCFSDKESSKAFFHLMKREQQQIEQEIGQPLDWRELPEKISSKIILFKNADPANQTDWPNQHAWLKQMVEKFDTVFRQRVRDLNPEDWDEESQAA